MGDTQQVPGDAATELKQLTVMAELDQQHVCQQAVPVRLLLLLLLLGL